jgi:hypothetical protein
MRNVVTDLYIHGTKTIMYAWSFLIVDVSLYVYFKLIRCFNNSGCLQFWKICLYTGNL